jgi:Phage Tail Protein X
MFIKGSRYRNLTETVFLNAKGERLRGKNLRLIPLTESRALHTVRDGDRLDSLAYKYYSDTTKWWQISDANPQRPFPIDLLDQRPLAEEWFVLTHLDFEKRFEQLLIALKQHGTVVSNSIRYFESREPYESVEITKPGFLEENVLIIYPPDERTKVLGRIQEKKFNYLDSFLFKQGPNNVESFTIDDLKVKQLWHQLLDDLRRTPGVTEVQSTLMEATLYLAYNTSLVARESILNLMKKSGFAIDAAPDSRTGKKINIPPNQIV